MRLLPTIHRALAISLGLSFAFAGGAAAQPSASEGNVTYRCPGNDYKNTISAKEADRLGCKKLVGEPITVIQMTKPRAGPAAAASSTARGGPGGRATKRTTRSTSIAPPK